MKVASRIVVLALTGSVSACHAQNHVEPSSEPESEVLFGKGSGSFLMEGRQRFEEKSIRVYYHKPEKFSGESPILIVLPGAGRNGDDYRDSWVDASERYGVLVLSPSYAEQDYDIAAYQFGGVIKNLQLYNLRIEENGQVYRMNDEDIAFEIVSDPSQLLFSDFDSLFEIAVKSIGSRRSGYHLFGHSAGGQILHRLEIFY